MRDMRRLLPRNPLPGSLAPLIPLVCIAVQGCTVNEVITAEETELIVAEDSVDESMLLDIGVVEFADGVPEENDPGDTGIYQEIKGRRGALSSLSPENDAAGNRALGCRARYSVRAGVSRT